MANIEFSIKRDATRPELEIEIIQQSDGTALDITGATAKFYMEDGDGTVKVNGSSATLSDATNGKVKYTWAAADTNTAGTYYGEFILTLSGGGVLNVPQDGYIEITITADVV